MFSTFEKKRFSELRDTDLFSDIVEHKEKSVITAEEFQMNRVNLEAHIREL